MTRSEDGDEHAAATVSGAYEARMGNAVQRLAVNVNPQEGDLTRFDPDLLPRQFTREPLNSTDDASPLMEGDSASYFRWLLGAVFSLLVIEPWLALRFGRGRA